MAVGTTIAPNDLSCATHGSELGLGGYFTLPYAYLTDANLADDFWTVEW